MTELVTDTPVPKTPEPAPSINSPQPKLHYGRLRSAADARNHWEADIAAGTMLKAVLAPTYWAHYATLLKPKDLIEAFWEDGSQEADLRVMFVGRAEARVELKTHKVYDRTTDADAQTDEYEVKWKGPGAKFAVVRKDTGAVIKDRLYPRSEAVAYLREHLGRMRQ